MLPLQGHSRIFLYQQPVVMHKSFEGLSQEVEKAFPGELFTSAFFLFFNRRRDSIKILFWDGDGFVIWYKRLEKGSFRTKDKGVCLNRRELFLLLEGVTPKRLEQGTFFFFSKEFLLSFSL